VSTKGRITFAVSGAHPLLVFTAQHLIESGYANVPIDEEPDFILVGGLFGWDATPTKYPRILLSSGAVYSDRDHALDVRDRGTMKEDEPFLVPSPLAANAREALQYMIAETHFLAQPSFTLVLRVFDVFGPSLQFGEVYEVIQHCVQGKVCLDSPGYQVRTHLYEEEYLFCFDKFLKLFLQRKVNGIFNVGSDQPVSYVRLVDSIKDALNLEVEVELRPAPLHFKWWIVPDLTRLRAIVNWTPKVSVRSGLLYFDIAK
jgi:nucleoside-diphosphate-sugar epimerase